MSNKYYHTKQSVNEYVESAKDVNGQELIDKFKLVLPKNASVLEY
ncbi:MAG: hypothetical protein AB8B72_11745 [Crocinitomicaceae bacterium]